MKVFVTGGTGYMGRRLILLLVPRGHEIKALARPGPETRLPAGTTPVVADPLRMDSYTEQVRGVDTFVHLIGVAHPSLAKAKEFREISLVSAQVAVKAACDARIGHFIYLSVAQPAKLMHAFRCAKRRRKDDSGKWDASDVREAVVYLGAGSSLGVCASAVLLGLRTAARDEGISASAGTGHHLTNARYLGLGS